MEYSDPSIPCAHEDVQSSCNYCHRPCEVEPTYCRYCKEYKIVPENICQDCGEEIVDNAATS